MIILQSWLLVLLFCAARLAGVAGEGEGAETWPLELTGANFTSYLNEQNPTRWILMEYYAHWCGACRHFQPEYEKIAAFFQQRGELQPKIVVARVDCANEAAICNRFGIRGYPTMKIGVAADFAAENMDSLTNVEPRRRNKAGVVEFLEKHLDAKLKEEEFDTGAQGNGNGGEVEVHQHPQQQQGGQQQQQQEGQQGQQGQQAVAGSRREPIQVDLNDVEGATIEMWRYIVTGAGLMEGLEARQALQDWLDLLAAHHPVPRCLKGAKGIRGELDSLWPDVSPVPYDALRDQEICPGTQFKEWSSCAGSQPGTRGYTCGLWLLMHAVAARMPAEGNSGALWMAGAKGFIKHYFQCSDCSKHFVAFANSEEGLKVQSRKDAVLWAWVAHNKVNGRLARTERENPSEADPAFPHLIWPTAQQCPTCRKSPLLVNGNIPDWDLDAVYAFLIEYYTGEKLKAGEGEGGGQPGLRGLLAKRTKRASWLEAIFVCGVVGGVVYMVLKGNNQYRLRKSESRLL